MFVAGVDQASIDGYVASERQKATEELATFLVANDLGREKWSLRVEDGGAYGGHLASCSRNAVRISW